MCCLLAAWWYIVKKVWALFILHWISIKLFKVVTVLCLTKARFPLPELMARVNGPSWQVTGFHYPGRVDGRAFPLAELTGRQHDGPSTRLVETLRCIVLYRMSSGQWRRSVLSCVPSHTSPRWLQFTCSTGAGQVVQDLKVVCLCSLLSTVCCRLSVSSFHSFGQRLWFCLCVCLFTW